MALNSPGVQVTIIDQSQYLPAASNSVPLILLATAQNKADPTGTAVAAATTAANAGKLYQLTSQRDLATLYGNPFFYKTSTGTPIHGYELNEYGLLAAWSLLGVTNACYVLRADIDLSSLVGTLSRPDGAPADGTYWLDTTNSSWGIYEFNATTGQFVLKTPTIFDKGISEVGTNGYPYDTLGNIGDYAVVPNMLTSLPIGKSTYFYKNRFNAWVEIGSAAWQSSLFTVLGTKSTPTPAITANSDSFSITYNSFVVTIAPTQATVDNIVTQINNAGIAELSATNVNGKLGISISSYRTNASVALADVSGTLLEKLGITPGTYYAPDIVYGDSASMPLWSSSQQYPHPTGSVWIKTSTAGNGLDLIVNKYSAANAGWSSVNTPAYTSADAANADLDSVGGKNIPAGSLIALYQTRRGSLSPVVIYERLASGATLITGGTSNITIPSGKVITVAVSQPGTLTDVVYSFTTSGGDLSSFITDWTHANIVYTSITETTDGSVQLSHALGGEIYVHDYQPSGGSGAGQSAGVLSALGLTPEMSMNVTYDKPFLYTTTVTSTSNSNNGGSATGSVTLNVTSSGLYYSIISTNSTATTGFQAGDTVTFSGAVLGGTTPANDLVLNVLTVDGSGKILTLAYASGTPRVNYLTHLSNWVMLDYTANEGAPAALPLNSTNWYYSTATEVDIMVQQGGAWKGYGNVAYDSNGHPAHTGSNMTDPAGVIMSATAPTTQSDGTTAVAYGDLWLDTSDLENYPLIYRWQSVNGYDQWVLINNADHHSSSGIVFADARWGKNSNVDPVNDPIPTIAGLMTSNYVDLDAPNPALYPQGILLFNTRRSGYNVKKFTTNYFTAKNFQTGSLPLVSYTWVTEGGLKEDGSAYMGRKAQRNLVVQAMKAALDTNVTIREEDNFFNLISCPGYPELQPDMVTLNNDRNNTAYIIGDTPLRLKDQATDITNWANNTVGATESGEDGWVTRDEYLGVFYPSGITTDLSGAPAVVPASHMMLRTFLRNDTIAYPWLAAAGTRRGTIDNATNIGYLDAATGEFVTVKNRMAIRDVLYTNQINPMAYFTGIGLLNYGNKSSFASQSALDRTNVGRLVAYIRQQLQIAARPFVFEPNDALTRSQLAGVIQSLFVDLVAKRGLYDYIVVCDESNNYAARIDRNELWVDVAIEPVKAAEFIYIPVRIVNTGSLAAA